MLVRMDDVFFSHWSDRLDSPIVLSDQNAGDSVLEFFEQTHPKAYEHFVLRYESDRPGEPGEIIWPLLCWRTYGEDDAFVTARLTPQVTFETLEQVFGPLLHDPSAPLSISVGAIGGDGSSIPWFQFELGTAGRIVARVIGGAYRLVRSELYKNQREALLRWQRSGVMNDELRLHLQNDGPYWSEERFTDVFGVEGRERGEVLRAAGFEWRWVPDINDHTWVSLDFLGE